MKVFVCFTFFFFISTATINVQAINAKDITPEVLAIVSACQTETGASDADIAAMVKHEPATTMEGKCVKSCILQKLSLMGADGKINKDAAMKLLDIHLKGDVEKIKVAEMILDACIDKPVPSDLCEAAEQHGLCMIEEAGKRGIGPDQM